MNVSLAFDSAPRRRALARGALLALVVVAYANSLAVPFVFDDERNIVRNPLVRHLRFAATPWLAAASGATPDQVGTFKSRYLAMASFAVGHRLHGLDARGFHVGNGLIHLVATLLVFGIVWRALELPAFAGSRLRARGPTVAFLVAALFAVHPLQTQAVTYIVQRMASLAGCLGLAAVWCHLRARASASAGSLAGFRAATVAALLAALLTKESAAAFPLLVVAVDLALFGGGWRARLRWLATPLVTLFVPLIRLAALVLETADPARQFDVVTRAGTAVGRWSYLATESRVIVRYLRLLVFPAGQSIDHDVDLSPSFADPRAAICGLLVLGMLGLGVAWIVRGRRGEAGWRLAGLGLVWFFVAQVVESSVLPIADVMVEHRLYLPLAGFALAVVAAAHSAVGDAGARRVSAVLGLSILALTAVTRARNEVWRDELALWRQAERTSPQKVRVLFNIGSLLGQRGEVDEAARYLERALERDPHHLPSLINLGLVAHRRGSPERARELYERALALDPGHAVALLNLGDLEREQGRAERAAELYRRAAAAAPRDPTPRQRLRELEPAATSGGR